MLSRYKNFPIQVKASLWFLICSFLQKGISVITTPIFTRLVSTAEYGQYSSFNSWLSIVTVFITLQLSAGVYTQGLIKFSEERPVFSSSLQGLNFVLISLWTLIYLPFRSYINSLMQLTTVQVLSMLIMIWATSIYNFWAAEQRVEYKYKKLVILTLIVSLFKPIISIICILLSEDKVTAWVLSLALAELIGFAALFFIQLRNGKVFFSKRFWVYALGFNLPLVPHYLSQQVLNSSDRIMIQSLIGSSEAGIYGLAYSISMIMTLFNTAIMQTLSPWIYQKLKDRKETDISSIAYLTLVIIAIVNLLLIALAPEAVAIFAPKSYYAAIWVIPPVAMSTIFMYSYDLFAKFEFYYEKTKFIMIASILGALLNIALNCFFLQKVGFYAAAYTTLFCYIIYALAHYLFMQKICKDYLNGAVVYKPSILFLIYGVFIIIGFLLMLTYSFPIIRYTIVISSCLVALIKRDSIKTATMTLFELRKNV